jgi:hypothetical protein
MASPAYLCWLFGWRQDAVDRAAADLVEAGELTLTTIAGWEGQYLLDPCPS